VIEEGLVIEGKRRYSQCFQKVLVSGKEFVSVQRISTKKRKMIRGYYIFLEKEILLSQDCQGHCKHL
jgi:hypothetical protein